MSVHTVLQAFLEPRCGPDLSSECRASPRALGGHTSNSDRALCFLPTPPLLQDPPISGKAPPPTQPRSSSPASSTRSRSGSGLRLSCPKTHWPPEPSLCLTTCAPTLPHPSGRPAGALGTSCVAASLPFMSSNEMR